MIIKKWRPDIKKNNSICNTHHFDLKIENRVPYNFIPKYNLADVFMLNTKIYFQNLIKLIIYLENKLKKLSNVMVTKS